MFFMISSVFFHSLFKVEVVSVAIGRGKGDVLFYLIGFWRKTSYSIGTFQKNIFYIQIEVLESLNYIWNSNIRYLRK